MPSRAAGCRLRWGALPSPLPPLLLLLGGVLPGIFALPEPPRSSVGQQVSVHSWQDRKHCGAMDAHTQDWLGGGPVCGSMMSTNCSVTYESMKCPKSCPYFAPNNAFACLFSCVKAEQCWEANPDRPFADPETMTCMSCDVEGCRSCIHRSRCEECHDSFTLSDDGKSCDFYLDKLGVFDSIATALAALVGFLIVLGVLWGSCCGGHPDAEVNNYAIFRARRHRHMCKTISWELSNKRRAASMLSLDFEFHKKNICGVGLALFYNSAAFTICLAFLCWLVTSMVYKRSDVHAALSNFDESPADLYMAGVLPKKSAPAVVVSRLYICDGKDQTNLKKVVLEFARDNFYGLGFLWLALFGMAFCFVKAQKHWAAVFNSQNLTMADFAIRITGLPKDLTDEADIKAWLEGEFRKACPGTFKRPLEVVDGGKLKGDIVNNRPGTQIEVYGVSLCYDYFKDWAAVDDILTSMNMRAELEAGIAANAGGAVPPRHRRHLTSKNFGGDQAMKEQLLRDREQVRKWFEGAPEERLKTNGEAFCVFTWHDDVERVWQAWNDRENNSLRDLRHPGNPDEPIDLCFVYCEPPSVNWQFLGTPLRLKAVARGFAYIACLILFILGCILYPYYRGILLPYSALGNAASGTKTAIMGNVVGGLNTVVQIQIWMTSFNVGFHRREDMDRMVLSCNVCLMFINIGFSILVSAVQAYHLETDPHPIRDFVSLEDMEPLATENAIATNVYQMMMPGFFFVGNLTMLVMAGAWPWIFNNFLAKMIYVWRALPKPLLKVFRVILPWAPDGLDGYPLWRAERGLEPMEIQIGDYANFIVIPSVCMVTLFAMSPATNKMFQWMLGWSIFYYCFLRYLHTRFCKKCYYTSNIVDNFVNILWGIPLSIVAAAWCQWGCRSKILFTSFSYEAKFALVFATFFVSFALWVLAYIYGVKPYKDDLQIKEEEQLDFKEVKERTFYSWFNCNPVFALKCEYLWRDAKGSVDQTKRKQHPAACGEDPDHTRFYQVGKEYLFLKPERQYLALPTYWNGGWPGNFLEFETYLELALGASSAGAARLFRRGGGSGDHAEGDLSLARQMLLGPVEECKVEARSAKMKEEEERRVTTFGWDE